MRLRIAAAVVDRGGRVVAAARMDDVNHLNLEVAVRKARAAQSFGVPLKDLLDGVAGDVALMQAFVAMGQEVIVLPGGFPIVSGARVIAGLGLAGGHHQQDHDIGQQVIAELIEFS